MGKFLRVLVIFFFLFSAAALTLGILLFLKRELLKGRTQKLEDTIIMLGTTVETDPEVIEGKPEHQARDISSCTAEILDPPDYSVFWNTYSNELELTAPATMDIAAQKKELMTYYLRNPITQKIDRDPITGYPITEGKGTMQEVLDNIIARAEQQYGRLNETRQQLIDLREEELKTIEDLNHRKRELREALNKIVQLEATIRELEAKIVQLESEIRTLKARIADLEAEVIELKRTIVDREDTIAERDQQIAQLKKELDQALGDRRGPIENVFAKIDSGRKGTIVSVDTQWNFVVFKVEPQLVEEITKIMDKLDEASKIPNLQFIVRRNRDEGPGDFVTKIRFKQLRKDQDLCIADILTNWRQKPIKKGDLVWFD